MQRPILALRLWGVFLFTWSCIAVPCAPVFAQCTLSCNASLQVSLDQNGEAFIELSALAPNVAVQCPNDVSVELVTTFGAPLANPLTCDQAGKVVVGRVRHLPTGNYCSTNLTVRDLLPPVVQCQEHFVSCSQNTDPAIFGHPEWSDNCTDNCSGLNTDVVVALGCNTMQNGIPVIRRIDRTWLVRDQFNNVSNCLERIWLERPDISQVVFPPDLDGMNNAALTCEQNPLDLDLTGRPLLDEALIASPGPCALGISHSDQKIEYCGPGGYVILRKWTVVGACSNNIATATQTIRVEDRKAPVMTPPPPVTINTSPLSCGATVTLAKGTATDNCSAVTISAVWPFGSGFGPFNNVPPGIHRVTYTATDACGNTKTATSTVRVADNTPPSMVCQPALQISLTTGGIAVIEPDLIDAGSRDNCGGTLTRELARDSSNLYGPEVILDCKDLGTAVRVSLRIRDENNLENFCDALITVSDLLRPVIQCPGATTLHCQQDEKDLNLTGKATATDNCGIRNIAHQDVATFNSCHIGSVLRTWTATDSSGNTRSCVQNIALTPLRTTTVTFPNDLTLNRCISEVALSPDSTGRPRIGGEACSALSITFRDQRFNSAVPPACYTIARTWKVIDFCVYDLNQPAAGGYWEKTQVITVTDRQKPLLSLPPDVTVSTSQSGCLAEVVLSDVLAADCSGPVTITHNSPYATQPGKNASGLYPTGIHTVVFTATDACGNTETGVVRVTAADLTPPAMTCTTNALLYIGSNGTVQVPVQTVVTQVSDNCAPADSLRFTLLPSILECGQVGQTQVTILVKDPTGNSTACQARITLADTLAYCTTPSAIAIGGQLKTYFGKPVQQMGVRIITDDGVQQTVCDTAGRYTLADILAGDTCIIRPYHTNETWLNGVTTLDLAMISQHILNLKPLNNIYKIIAADANRSNTVTTLDIVAIRRLILGIQDTIPNSTSWRFVPSDFVFANPQNPFTHPIPDAHVLLNAKSDALAEDFVAIKLGDVNGTVNPADPRTQSDTVFLDIDMRQPDMSGSLAIPLYLPEWWKMQGFQSEISWLPDQLKVERIEYPVSDLFHTGHCALFSEKGRLTLSWNPEKLVRNLPDSKTPFLILHTQVTEGSDSSKLFSIVQQRLASECYPASDMRQPVALRFIREKHTQKAPVAALHVSPNPFRECTTFSFSLAKPAQVTISVTDLTGHLVFARILDLPMGQHTIPIENGQLGTSGVYVACVQAEDQKIYRKLVVSE
jgi:hypothetical protein